MKLISVKCRWCQINFYICRSCWRGQAYCSDSCRRFGYLRSHRKSQQKYRQTEKGKKAHCQSENRRRHRKKSPEIKNMDEGTSKLPFTMQIGMMREGNSVCFGATKRNQCQFCGRSGEIVPQFPRRNYGNRVSG